MILYRIISSYEDDSIIVLRCLEFPVRRQTPCGFWIRDDWQGKDRFVRKDTRKRFAHPDKESALKSFELRKVRQIKILEGQLRHAKFALQAVRNGQTRIHDDSFTLT
jgi:hypothetical protein